MRRLLPAALEPDVFDDLAEQDAGIFPAFVTFGAVSGGEQHRGSYRLLLGHRESLLLWWVNVWTCTRFGPTRWRMQAGNGRQTMRLRCRAD